jgi:hypothetical protein
MLLRVRQDGRIYEVQVPEGTRVVSTRRGEPGLIIPGDSPGDTHIWVAPLAILKAARKGMFGIALKGEIETGTPRR